jgi:hypothetical protein
MANIVFDMECEEHKLSFHADKVTVLCNTCMVCCTDPLIARRIDTYEERTTAAFTKLDASLYSLSRKEYFR